MNPALVLQDLQKIGKDVVLLCYETPEKFCHRHIAAQWLKDQTGIDIGEFELEKPKDLFDF